jgi:hypothetical protein
LASKPSSGGSITQISILSDNISYSTTSGIKTLCLTFKYLCGKTNLYINDIITIDKNSLCRFYNSELSANEYLDFILNNSYFIEYNLLCERSHKLEELKVNTLGTDFKAIDCFHNVLKIIPIQFEL